MLVFYFDNLTLPRCFRTRNDKHEFCIWKIEKKKYTRNFCKANVPRTYTSKKQIWSFSVVYGSKALAIALSWLPYKIIFYTFIFTV